jgi:hypothetical protein
MRPGPSVDPDIADLIRRLKAKLPPKRPDRDPSLALWRMPCAGCGAELKLEQAAALVPRGANYAPVCFHCRDASRGNR